MPAGCARLYLRAVTDVLAMVDVLAKLRYGTHPLTYNQSMITRALKPSLGPKSLSIFLSAVAPGSNAAQQTLATMRLCETVMLGIDPTARALSDRCAVPCSVVSHCVWCVWHVVRNAVWHGLASGVVWCPVGGVIRHGVVRCRRTAALLWRGVAWRGVVWHSI